MGLIEEKKNTVGAGYLTDQGALFLIAGELGVRLEHVTSSDLTLKDLYIGANDITVVARVLAVYPTSEYARKDGGKGRYRRVGLFDANNVVRLTLWDDRVEDIERIGVTVDMPVRIVSGYVKQGLDGKPNLNLGRRGRIERIEDAEISNRLDGVDKLSRKLGGLDNDEQIVALDAVLSTEPRRSDFTRSDGSAGSLLQFRVSDPGKKDESRIAIWNPSISLQNVGVGREIRITNLKVKQSNQGERELHGDAGSVVLLLQPKSSLREFVVASIDLGETVQMLVADAGRKICRLDLVGEATVNARSAKAGDKIRTSPDEDSKDGLICRSPGSVEILASKDCVAELSSVTVKINELKSCSWPLMVESIALSRGGVQQVHLKDGSIVDKGEVVIGDDTAEVKLVGWRDHAAKIVGIEPGQRIRAVGVTPQVSKMGILTLQMSQYSRIEKLRGR